MRLVRGRGPSLALALLVSLAAPPEAAGAPRDPLAAARQLYNTGDYDAAIAAAELITQPPLVHPAKLVAGRARLERFRRTRMQTDLEEARAALASIDGAALLPRERVELVIGFAESLFLEAAYGAAAELFQTVLDHPAAWQAAGPGGRERLLEWWAGAMDRQAQQARGPGRDEQYLRLRDRMERELERDPVSPVASYWLAAAARGAGDLDHAWDAAIAGWLRARLAGTRARALCNDLDRLVREAIIPARAKRLSDPSRDASRLESDLLTEWNELKTKWPI